MNTRIYNNLRNQGYSHEIAEREAGKEIKSKSQLLAEKYVNLNQYKATYNYKSK